MYVYMIAIDIHKSNRMIIFTLSLETFFWKIMISEKLYFNQAIYFDCFL